MASRTEWENEMLELIDSEYDLTESQLSKLVDRFEIELTKGENRRWSRSVESICKVGSRYFKVDWEEGLTECQEDMYYDQPTEVELFEEERTITKTYTHREWKDKY